MPNNEFVHRTELPKLFDNGTNNNYGEWKTKSYHKLRKWDLLKYIEGPDSNPPIIPPLWQPTEYHGLDENNHITTVHVLGNADKHLQATIDAKPWMTVNNQAVSRLVTALPSHQLHLVQNAIYAKDVWETLKLLYQPCNSLRAATIKAQIIMYRCTSDMNVAKWLNDMQQLYNSLCDLELECMTNRELALAILDLMPQDDGWREFVSGLRTKAQDADAQGLPIISFAYITAIRDENWFRHKDDQHANFHIFSACFEAQKKSSSQKCLRSADIVTSTFVPPPQTKRARMVNPNKAHLQCTNVHCNSKAGHDTADCISFSGAKAGQYGDWWRGPWNIHLPESQHSKANNVPPKTHPAYARWYSPSVNQTYITPPTALPPNTDNSLEQSNTSPLPLNDKIQTNSVFTSDTNHYAWNTHFSDTAAHATLPVLNPDLPRDNSCHYDLGANCHVFHDRSAFENYESIPPPYSQGFRTKPFSCRDW